MCKLSLFLLVLFCSSVSSAQTCNTSSQPLPDVGAQVAACISAIKTGKVVIDQGGTWATNVVVPSGISIFYSAGANNITNGMGSRQPILSMSSNTSFKCESKVNTIGAPSTGDETIICGVDQGTGCINTAHVITNVQVDGCHFISQGSSGSPLDGTVWLENCVHCTTDYNFFDNIKNIQILIGAASLLGNRSYDYDASHNTLIGSSNSSIAVINGSQAWETFNYVGDHGSGAGSAVDIEPNASTDWAQNNEIAFNFDDATTNSLPFRDYGVSLQCAGYPKCMFNKVRFNTLWGGAPGTGTGLLNQGVATEGSYQQVEGNTVVSTNSQGIGLGGDHGKAFNNAVVCSSFIFSGVSPTLPSTHNWVENNWIDNSPCKYGQAVLEAYSTMKEYLYADHTIFKGNDGVLSYTLLPNNGSVVVDDLQPDGNGLTFRVPVGFGTQPPASTAPAGLTKGLGTACNSAFAGGIYYWQVTAVDANGIETPRSAEFSHYAGTSFGCFSLIWNKVTGAACYKIYRSATSGGEVPINSVCGGATSYADSGQP